LDQPPQHVVFVEVVDLDISSIVQRHERITVLRSYIQLPRGIAASCPIFHARFLRSIFAE
jgi:hypothetical protein